MALSTERNQVLFGIVTQSGSGLKVVHLDLTNTPAELAAPPIAFQNVPAQIPVRLPVEP